ncbi:MAG TPA: hypothetical protein VGA15_16910 [Bradyrhizobium sp.]
MGKKMRISARPMALFAGLWPARALPWIFATAVLAAVAAPSAANARKAGGAGGGYDGIWSVLIITQAGSCDPAYSYPFRVSGGRISTAGAADVSGSVGPGGVVAVRISAGGRVASGNGRLSGSSGSGRWTAKVSSGNCSGRWQATRG